MLTTFPQCSFSLEFPEILCQILIGYQWVSVSGNSKTMHCGILINIPLFMLLGAPPSDGSAVEDANSGELNRDSLVNLTRQVVDAVQLGTLGAELNLTILGIDVQEPLPPPESKSYTQ